MSKSGRGLAIVSSNDGRTKANRINGNETMSGNGDL